MTVCLWNTGASPAVGSGLPSENPCRAVGLGLCGDDQGAYLGERDVRWSKDHLAHLASAQDKEARCKEMSKQNEGTHAKGSIKHERS